MSAKIFLKSLLHVGFSSLLERQAIKTDGTFGNGWWDFWDWAEVQTISFKLPHVDQLLLGQVPDALSLVISFRGGGVPECR